MEVFISQGNKKLGMIPSVSLPPISTCEPDPPCAKLCYARKYYTGFAKHAVAPTWDNNLEFYRSDPDGYFEDIGDQLSGNKILSLFRWHVSGDIQDERYLRGMIEVAGWFPWVHFLVYTRRLWALPARLDNFNIVRSLWFGDVDAAEDRLKLPSPWFAVIPKNEPATCQGQCSKCGICWNLEPGEGMTVNLH